MSVETDSMDILKQCFYAFYRQDFGIFFSDDNFVIVIYLLAFCILFLENGVIFASFLPGDTLLIFLGLLVEKGLLNFSVTLGILTIAAGLGSWMSYLQGKWLEHNKLTIYRLINFPERYCHCAYRMFHTYGLLALFLGRFVVFVRTLLPIIAGLSGLNSICFHFFNWVSAFVWILILVVFGFFLGKTDLVQLGGDKLIFLLFVLLFCVIFFIGLIRYVKKIFYMK